MARGGGGGGSRIKEICQQPTALLFNRREGRKGHSSLNMCAAAAVHSWPERHKDIGGKYSYCNCAYVNVNHGAKG
jgi:hypothetical protein